MSGVRRVPIGELVTIRGGGTPARSNPAFYDGGDIPWVTPKDMKSWEITAAEINITRAAVAQSSTKLVPANTVLLVNRSGILKHTAPVAINRRPLAINQDLKSLECGKHLFPDYLARIIKASEPIILKWVRATTADNYPIENIRNLEIPLPPLEEQRRIAAILDQADTLRRHRRSALERFDDLLHAVFLEMFGDPLTNPKRWTRKCLADIGEIVTGNTPPRDESRNFGTAIEWIKSDNITEEDYYATKAEECLSEIGRKIARLAPPNSILVTCIAGSPNSIGKAAMVDREVAFNQQINAVIPKNGVPDFLYGQLRTSKALVQGASTNSMKGMVSKTRFEEVQVMFPPLDLQRTFAERVRAIEALKAHHRAHLTHLDALFASLQHRAFEGTL